MTKGHEFWTDRLSAYLDDGLGPDEREAVEGHLSECPDCSAVLDELKEVVRRARALVPGEPGADLWPGIEARLGEDPLDGAVIPLRAHTPGGDSVGADRTSWRRPGLVAAAVALVALGWSGGALWRSAPSSTGPGSFASDPAVGFASDGIGVTGPLSPELARLEARVLEGLSGVDEETRATLLRNLALIDRAIRESLQALQEDPESDYLRAHVDGARTRKQGYLERILQTLEVQA